MACITIYPVIMLSWSVEFWTFKSGFIMLVLVQSLFVLQLHSWFCLCCHCFCLLVLSYLSSVQFFDVCIWVLSSTPTVTIRSGQMDSPDFKTVHVAVKAFDDCLCGSTGPWARLRVVFECGRPIPSCHHQPLLSCYHLSYLSQLYLALLSGSSHHGGPVGHPSVCF